MKEIMASNNLVGFASHFKLLASNWTVYTLIGSFIIYFMGYLSLRFHMTVFGLGTDISVFDERYFFAGVNFFIYIIGLVPILILIGIIFYFPIKIILKLFKRMIDSFFPLWHVDTKFILLIGIILSTMLIQVLMRKCFDLTNFLVLHNFEILEIELWLMKTLKQEEFWSIGYFLVLVTGFILSFIIWWNIQRVNSKSQEFFWLKNLLSVLIIIQFLFLPINYGALILYKTTPKVSIPKVLIDRNSDNLEFWLVWEGQRGVTYLTRDLSKNDKRTLITLNKKDVNYEEILCYDNLIKIVLDKEKSCTTN